MIGQNLFFIIFERDDDMEMMLEGCPWFFKRQLILFERLIYATNRRKIKLINSLFWIKIGLCPPEYDKKDMMHAIDTTFGGVLHSKIKADFYQFRVNLDVQKPLRRGIFISMEEDEKV